ncbi:MAG: hypothetical protein HY021_05400 [Burkholderiales bacterium]|nr:hypothetical protein [Burkholderiales bacterium]
MAIAITPYRDAASGYFRKTSWMLRRQPVSRPVGVAPLPPVPREASFSPEDDLLRRLREAGL